MAPRSVQQGHRRCQMRTVSSSSNNTVAIAPQLMPWSSSTSAFARQTGRCTADPSQARSIKSCRGTLSRNPGRIMESAESDSDAWQGGGAGFPKRRGRAFVSPSGSGCPAMRAMTPTSGASCKPRQARRRSAACFSGSTGCTKSANFASNPASVIGLFRLPIACVTCFVSNRPSVSRIWILTASTELAGSTVAVTLLRSRAVVTSRTAASLNWSVGVQFG